MLSGLTIRNTLRWRGGRMSAESEILQLLLDRKVIRPDDMRDRLTEALNELPKADREGHRGLPFRRLLAVIDREIALAATTREEITRPDWFRGVIEGPAKG